METRNTNMKINSNKLRKAQVITDCVMIALFAISSVIFLTQGRHAEAAYNLLLALAWLLILMKDRLIGHYAKLIDLYKEVRRENEEFLDKLVSHINEKQKDNETDTRR